MRTLEFYRGIGAKLRKRSPQECKELARKREAQKPSEPGASLVQYIRGDRFTLKSPGNAYRIPLGDLGLTSEVAFDRRKKNYKSPQPSFQKSYLADYNEGRYSSKCKWTKFSYIRWVESWGCVISPQYLYYRVHTNDGIRHGTIKAPRGWAFAIDDLGIKIIKGKLDYHITASDVVVGNLREACHKAKENYARRRAEEKLQAAQERKIREDEKAYRQLIKDAAADGVYVCMRDATCAGNCQGGVESWAFRHGLETTKHYLPTTVAKFGTDEPRRTKAVIYAAIRRHGIEMDQGYCRLEYHILGFTFDLT